jgi:hypothetical protein
VFKDPALLEEKIVFYRQLFKVDPVLKIDATFTIVWILVHPLDIWEK